jgi:repressor LexA
MARQRSQTLSSRHVKILEVLETYQEENGFPPTIREIGSQAGISSTSVVNYYLDQLVEHGYLERQGKASRGLRLVKPLAAARGAIEGLIRVRLMGRIAAGKPLPVPASDFDLYDEESGIDIPASLLAARDRKQLYALEVEGNSMIDAMVNDGDLVILRPTNQAENGEMVAAWLYDQEATTLKFFFRENGRIRLQPANPAYQPLFLDGEALEIQGKVVMVIRQFRGLAS